MFLHKHILLYLLIACTFRSVAQSGFSLKSTAKKVEIPIEIHNNLVVVPVKLNNLLPLNFIVDTGVRTTILTEKIYAEILHLTASKKITITAPWVEKKISAFITNNVTIDLPGVQGKGLGMLVLDDNYLELRESLGFEVQGILGYELFSRFIIKIDYEGKKMTLMNPQKFKPPQRYAQLPITIEDTKPYYMAKLNINDTCSILAKLMVDTGSSLGLFLTAGLNGKIVLPQKNIAGIIGKGLGGQITGRVARIKNLQLGKFSMPNRIAHFTDSNSYNGQAEQFYTVFCNGSIGGETLSRFDVIFDFPRERIYVKAKPSFRKKVFYNMSGVMLRAVGPLLKEFEIENVRAASAADLAGIQKGDRIIEINGYTATNYDLSQINELFITKPGKKINLLIKRGKETIKRKIELKSEI